MSGDSLKSDYTGDVKMDTRFAISNYPDAKAVCDKLSIPHEVHDFGASFKDCVIKDFVESYIYSLHHFLLQVER